MGQPDRVLLEATERRDSCRFLFRTPGGTGTVWLAQGEIVDAVIQGVAGERALLRILANRSVRISVEAGSSARERRITRALPDLIDEAKARRVQWEDLVRRLPPLSAVLEPGTASPPELGPEAAHVRSLVDGTRPLFAIIDEGRLDSLIVLRIVDQLMNAGAVFGPQVRPSGEGELASTSDLSQDSAVLAGLADGASEPESPVFPLTRHHAAEAPSEQKHPLVGRYEVLGRLGRGGMATVYLCRTRGEGDFVRHFALKVLRTHLSDNQEATEMLLREARFTGRLHHPNVVSVVDVGSNRGQPYLVMDYVPGCSAATLLEASRMGGIMLTERVAAAVALEALAGLHAAHTLGDNQGRALGLVHQDVSPENLLVGFDGVTRVSDFGVAQATGALVTPSSQHGKPQYLAPERVQGLAFDHRADIFALGVVLYRLLTGEDPFAAPTTEEVFDAVLSRPIPAPSAVGRRPQAVFDAVCMKALQRDPNDRYQSAEHFRGELLRVAVLNDLLALGGEVADVARRAVDALSPGSRLAHPAERSAAAVPPGAAIVLVRRKPRPAAAENQTVELKGPAARSEVKPLPVWAVAVFLAVSIGLALLLESLGSDQGAPRIPQQAKTPGAGEPSDDEPLGKGFLEHLGDPTPAPSAEPSARPE